MPATANTLMYLAVGDTLPYAEATLRDGAGIPVLLKAGDTVLFKMRRYNTDEPSLGGDAQIVAPGALATDPMVGVVQYVWQNGVGVSGVYEVQWKVTFQDGKTAHFPNKGTDIIEVSDVIPDPL